MRATVHFTQPNFALVREHLFPGDHDEHGAIALAGVRVGNASADLLVREVHPLWEDEFIPGEQGYRQISPQALARLGNRAHEQGLALVSCHSHPGATTRNGLSADDLAAHRRVFPHLLDIVGGPVAGIALGTASAAGEVWLPGTGPAELTAVRVHAHQSASLMPEPPSGHPPLDDRFDRQARLFGASGQQILRSQHVAVIGVGGGGSMLVEQLAHLGVGRITAIDYDVVKRHNLSRIVGATADDAQMERKKIDVARRLVANIDPSVEFVGIDGDLADRHVAERVFGCDFLFLATDTMTSRLVANAIAHAHFVPAVQIGAKVDLRDTGQIESVYVAIRPILPGGSCLHCAGLIDPVALRHEANTDEERAAQNYLGTPEVIDPSVITLNGIGASAATNLFMMSAVGLAQSSLWQHRLFDAQWGAWLTLNIEQDKTCPWCSRSPASVFARGDGAELPLRWTNARVPRVLPRGRMKRLWDRVKRRNVRIF